MINLIFFAVSALHICLCFGESMSDKLKFKPDNSVHGSENLIGWTATNNWLRYWMIQYNVLTIVGEPKHGLWKWTVPGADLGIWWCEMSGNWDPVDEGHDYDDLDGRQSGMKAIWNKVITSSAANKAGPLGKRAKIDELAVDFIKMDLTGDANMWYNFGTELKPVWWPNREGEVYIYSAYYGWKEDPETKIPNMMDGRREDGANIHLMVAVVVDNDLAGHPTKIKGIPAFGLHYDPGTKCPEMCGDDLCLCDAVLIDMKVQVNLEDDWTERLFYMEAPWKNDPEGDFGKKDVLRMPKDEDTLPDFCNFSEEKCGMCSGKWDDKEQVCDVVFKYNKWRCSKLKGNRLCESMGCRWSERRKCVRKSNRKTNKKD